MAVIDPWVIDQIQREELERLRREVEELRIYVPVPLPEQTDKEKDASNAVIQIDL
jgi:hypothetical protein